VLQNLGGIGNLTALPAGCSEEQVLAFDTGPGNMVIDQCMTALFGKKFDRGGAVAAQGRVLDRVVTKTMRQGYFSKLPPKSCGREEFGAEFTKDFIAMCRDAGGTDEDCVTTATALTAESILYGYRHFVEEHLRKSAPNAPVEFVVAGGGAKNPVIMRSLGEQLGVMGVTIRKTEELGIPAQAKEGMAFALLAWLTWNGLPGNLPAATGARRPVVLGKVTFG
jgi:anhydro-N-acetylmuramic acid kinase